MNNAVRRTVACGFCSLLLCIVAGCGKTAPPEFRLNMVAVARQQLPADQQQEVANILEAMFGTPDDPYVLTDTGLKINLIRMAAGPVKSDQFGNETGLYRRHCVHCHGTTGDGLGPTALLLNPYPRDYRQGKFKFKATERSAKPTDYDLEVILRHGIPGTAMPTFDLLSDVQVKALVEYVKYLSIRGETELRLIDAMADLSVGEKLPIARSNLVDELMKPIAESWTTAGEAIIQPVEKPEGDHAASIAKGKELFYSTKGNCAKCHGWGALGDGQLTDYDDWNKPIEEMTKDLASEEKKLKTDKEMTADDKSSMAQHVAMLSSVLHADAMPPRTATPRNLRQGIYRGGRRPLDIYRRIYAGINGMPMPAVGPATPGAKGTMDPDEIWNVVDYVLSLPFESSNQTPAQSQTVLGQAQF